MARPSKKRFELDRKQINYIKKLLNISKIEDVDKSCMILLKNKLKTLSDPRMQHKTKFKLWDIIICTVLAVLFGGESWDDVHDFVELHYSWLREFLLMTGGIPCTVTFERVFSIINPAELETVFNDFLFMFTLNDSGEQDIVNLDGRVSKGSARAKTEYQDKIKPLNVLNAYSNKYGICLASECIEDKTNEITAIPNILKRFNVKGNIITWDALNTQSANVEAVVDLKGDYVVPVKGNQKNLYEDLKVYFNDEKLEEIRKGDKKSEYLEYCESRGSKAIHYEYYQTKDIKWCFEKDKWKKLNSIGVVKKTTIEGTKKRTELRYYISSLGLDIEMFSKAIRNHWSVENKLHWHLDFTFRQDKNTTANKKALMNLELVNKFCLSILKKIKPFYKNISIRRIKKIMSYDNEKALVNMMCYLALSEKSDF